MHHYQIVPLSGLQRYNADHLRQAQQEAAYATLQVEAEVGALNALREGLGEEGAPVCPFTMRAVAMTLQAFPRLNAQLSSEGLCVYDSVRLGLMVVREDGVLVPAIGQAAQKTPAALAREAAKAVREARSGQMRRHKAPRPTFTIVDLSAYAVSAFTPILPIRSAGILGLGRVEQRFRPDAEGRPRTVSVQSISLTFDHRAADGEYAARFLTAVVERLEQPEALRMEEEAAPA